MLILCSVSVKSDTHVLYSLLQIRLLPIQLVQYLILFLLSDNASPSRPLIHCNLFLCLQSILLLFLSESLEVLGDLANIAILKLLLPILSLLLTCLLILELGLRSLDRFHVLFDIVLGTQSLIYCLQCGIIHLGSRWSCL